MVEEWSAQQRPIDKDRIRQIENELDRPTTTGGSDKNDKPEKPETEPNEEEGPEQ